MFELTVLTKSAAAQAQARQFYVDHFSFTPMIPISDTLDRSPTSFALITPQKLSIPSKQLFADTFWQQIDANVQEATADFCTPRMSRFCDGYQFFPEANLVYNEAVALQGALNAAGIEAEVRITMLDPAI